MRSRADRLGALAALAGLALALLAPAAGHGQAPGEEDGDDDPAASVVERADRLYFGGRPESALSLLGTVGEGGDAPYPVLWRSARASVALALMADEPEEEVRRLREAAAFGRRAAGRSADGVNGHYWLAAAAGLLAVRSGDGARIVELGREARRHAWAVLEIDPGHGGAHDVLGRVHMQVAKLPGWKRFMARLLGAGDVVEGASWEQAERHLREAVARSPEVIYYRLDLARLLAVRERDAEAARVARELLEVPTLHPFDPLLKERARALLAEVDAAGQPSP